MIRRDDICPVHYLNRNYSNMFSKWYLEIISGHITVFKRRKEIYIVMTFVKAESWVNKPLFELLLWGRGRSGFFPRCREFLKKTHDPLLGTQELVSAAFSARFFSFSYIAVTSALGNKCSTFLFPVNMFFLLNPQYSKGFSWHLNVNGFQIFASYCFWGIPVLDNLLAAWTLHV